MSNDEQVLPKTIKILNSIKMDHNIHAMIAGIVAIIYGLIEYSKAFIFPWIFIVIIVIGAIGFAVGLIRFIRRRLIN